MSERRPARGPAILAARRAAEASVSRGPKLEVDVASRMGSTSSSLPEMELDPEPGNQTQTQTRVQSGGMKPPKEP